MSSRPRVFVPSALADREAHESYTILSQNYYRVANELRGFSKHPPVGLPGHYYVFPAVMVFMSCADAFFQEHLTFSRYKIERSDLEDKISLLKDLDLLRGGQVPYNDFKLWLKRIFTLYSRDGTPLDASSDAYQNLLALRELRHAVAHYSPMFVSYCKWPHRLEQALQRAKPEIVNAGWVTNFSSPAVADWAHDTVKSIIMLFCSKSGATCPFTTDNVAFQW